jgi:hypothetical protein
MTHLKARNGVPPRIPGDGTDHWRMRPAVLVALLVVTWACVCIAIVQDGLL